MHVFLKGGWHDAADQLRYLLTSGNSVGRMLFAFRESSHNETFSDEFDYWGHQGPKKLITTGLIESFE